MKPSCWIIMGVAGSGKTTVGRALAERLTWRFIEGDDFHSPGSIRKMAQGIPLTDADRGDWLAGIHAAIRSGRPAVVACSALKEKYRRILRGDLEGVRFAFLNGDIDLFYQRLSRREDHFMGASMLRSQFEDLEIPAPEAAVHLDASRPADENVSALARFTRSLNVK
ncbi:MAG TPA: gluconokinase [Anaerolineales bacterium]|nr:gluconokinase [Anaerolineales bacterium]